MSEAYCDPLKPVHHMCTYRNFDSLRNYEGMRAMYARWRCTSGEVCTADVPPWRPCS